MQDVHPKDAVKTIIDGISLQYSPLTDACKEDLCQSLNLFSVAKSTLLVKEAQRADKLYFIVNGCFRVYYLKDSRDITDWFAFENEFVTSINSFFLSIPSPHYIESVEPTTFLEIAREEVYTLTEKHHCFETLARKAITQTMLQLQSRVVALQFETAQQKYDSLVKLRPDITQRVPLMHIASYLGITLETLSRIRNPKIEFDVCQMK